MRLATIDAVQVLIVAGATGLGAAVGGLIPRVAYRLAVPAGSTPRAGCHACDTRFPLGWAGWLVVGGRCPICRSRLGPPGWAYALTGAAACAGLAVRLPSHRPADLMVLGTWLVTVLSGAVLAGIDIQARRVPTRLVAVTAVAVVGLLVITAVTAQQMVLLSNAVVAAGLIGSAYLLVALLRPGDIGPAAHRRRTRGRVTVWQLARFLNWLVETPLPSRVRGGGGLDRFRDANTASAIVGTVCEFLRFGVRMGWVEPELLGQLTEPRYLRFLPQGFDPGEDDQRRTVRSRLIKFASVDAGIEWLTVEQVARLVDVTRHARDRFLVLLLWCTGIRIGEALGLHREDMHLLADSQALGCQVRGPHVHVRRRLNSNGAWAKSRRPRIVPVTSELGVCYADYLHERAMVSQAERTVQVLVNLFREPLGRAMSYSSVKGLFDRLAQRASLIARPHMLRHGAATEWISQGTDRAVVKELLGHVSDTSMNVYIHVPDGAKRAAVERADARRRQVTR